MKTISARHAADMLDIASRNIRSRHNREQSNLTPKQAASWLMNLVIELQEADGGWGDEPIESDLDKEVAK